MLLALLVSEVKKGKTKKQNARTSVNTILHILAFAFKHPDVIFLELLSIYYYALFIIVS